MNTCFWGKALWIPFHSIAYNYPEKNDDKELRNNIRDFYVNLKNVLPCKYCRKSYTQYLEELPIDGYLNGRRKLTIWAYLVHNKVNDKLRAQGHIKWSNPSLEQVDAIYEEQRAKCGGEKGKETCRFKTFFTKPISHRIVHMKLYKNYNMKRI